MFIEHVLCTRHCAKLCFAFSLILSLKVHVADTIIIPTVWIKKDAEPLYGP